MQRVQRTHVLRGSQGASKSRNRRNVPKSSRIDGVLDTKEEFKTAFERKMGKPRSANGIK